jgi:hypothetical protein
MGPKLTHSRAGEDEHDEAEAGLEKSENAESEEVEVDESEDKPNIDQDSTKNFMRTHAEPSCLDTWKQRNRCG